jgi:hypothetical protein
VALPLALLLCLALGSIAAGATGFSLIAVRIAVNFDAFHRALDVAEAGLERGVESLAARYESAAAPPDSLTVVRSDSLNGFTYDVRAEPRREPPGTDLNANGVAGEIVRYARSWGYPAAAASGLPGDEGPPVWRVLSAARGPTARERLVLEAAFERDPSAPAPGPRGSCRVVRLRWSALDP